MTERRTEPGAGLAASHRAKREGDEGGGVWGGRGGQQERRCEQVQGRWRKNQQMERDTASLVTGKKGWEENEEGAMETAEKLDQA